MKADANENILKISIRMRPNFSDHLHQLINQSCHFVTSYSGVKKECDLVAQNA